MAEIRKPMGLYRQASGIWKIDKVIRGERIKVSTNTEDLNEAKSVLNRYVAGKVFLQKASSWSAFVDVMYQNQNSWLHKSATGMAYRGKKSGKGSDITPQQLRLLLLRCGGRCEITGISLSFEKMGNHKTPPFQPSVDRIDSASGYHASNCRIVALAVNLAMREWGAQVISKIGKAIFLKELQEDVNGNAGNLTYPELPIGVSK